MSKKEQLENLAIYIGLRAAHEILIKLTNKPDSIHHLEQEADTYSNSKEIRLPPALGWGIARSLMLARVGFLRMQLFSRY